MAVQRASITGISRICSATATYERFGSLMREAGITRLADVTGLDVLGIPVFLAIRPLARSLVISTGKGVDRAAARTAALMESLEAWRAERIAEPDGVATFEELQPDAVDPDLLPAAVDAPSGSFRQHRFNWLPGSDARTGDRVWVPFEAVSLDFRAHRLGTPRLARNSNGLAAGNTRTEAALHGVCEVIERDAEWRWRHSTESRRIALDNVNDDQCRSVLDALAQHGVRPAAWDITSEVGVPSVGCVVLSNPDTDIWSRTGVHDGFCCRPTAEAALLGALLEAVQKRLTYISGSRDDVTREEMARANDAELAMRVWAELDAEPERVTLGELASCEQGTVDGNLSTIVDALRGAGFPQVVLVDVSRETDGPSVVKAMVPGMFGPFDAAAAPRCSLP